MIEETGFSKYILSASRDDNNITIIQTISNRWNPIALLMPFVYRAYLLPIRIYLLINLRYNYDLQLYSEPIKMEKSETYFFFWFKL